MYNILYRIIMEKSILFALSLLFVGFHAKAQIRVTYALDAPTFTLAHQSTDKFQTLDTTYLDITYSFKYRLEEKDDSLKGEDLMDLQIGKNYSAFFSRNIRELDQQNTESVKATMQFTPIPPEYIGFDIIFNHKENNLKVTNRIPYTSQVIEYKELEPTISWTYLKKDTATVMGYLCHAATCSYGGRNWKVYYASDIPLPYGPWMLNGAKALILKAEDTENNFVFEAVGLTQKPQPIVRFDWNRKVMKKEAWKQYERNMYKNAGSFVKNTGAHIIIMDNSERGFHRLNEDWSQYYNPLER